MAMASPSASDSHNRVGASPARVTGLRSLHSLAAQSPSLDKVPQQTNADMIITRLVPKKQPGVFVETKGEPVSDSMKRPVLGDLATIDNKPTLPDNFTRLTPRAKLKAVKQFLSAFEYKQTPATHFNTHKLRPLTRIMDTARMIIYSPQPIKCVEAVFLALYLTAGIPDCDRIPLGFKTSLRGQVFQHIVLLVQYGGKFGAFGISRQPDLMTKDIIFDCMSDIVENYKDAYEAAGHTVLKIRVGLPVEHKIQSPNYVCWRHLSLSPASLSWEECREALDNHSKKKNRLWDLWLLSGKGEDPRRKSVVRKATLDTQMPVDDATKNKKVKTQYTSMKALAEAEQMQSASRKSPGNEAVACSGPEQAKTRKERRRSAAVKSSLKTRLLLGKTSLLITQRAQHLRKLLPGDGLRLSTPVKRFSRVSFDMDNLKRNLIDLKSRRSRNQENGGGRLRRGKEQVPRDSRSKKKLAL